MAQERLTAYEREDLKRAESFNGLQSMRAASFLRGYLAGLETAAALGIIVWVVSVVHV